MKKMIFTLVALLLASMTMNSAPVIEKRGDTLMIAHGGDTLRLTGTQTIKELTGILDDTIVSINEEADQTINDEGEIIDAGTRQFAIDSQEIWARVARDGIICCTWGLVCLILVVLLFNYLKRRRKYKMVEKAIENNYPLPPYVFEGRTSAPSNYYAPVTPVQGSPVLEGTPVNEGEPVVDENGEIVPPPLGVQNDPWNGAQQQPVVGTPRMNWRAFQSSFVLVAVGLGLMLMFHETALMGIFAILVLIGLGKGFIEYQDQRDAINAWRNRK
ncbi:MAG: hypothetical protein IKX39_06450 [Muribaculaceae bacterium]|nr:hypothetical protein [Muribaculaceae bacterium]